MDNIGLFDLARINPDGSLILMPWAQEAYGVKTSDELLEHLEATEKIAEAEHERLMAELAFDNDDVNENGFIRNFLKDTLLETKLDPYLFELPCEPNTNRYRGFIVIKQCSKTACFRRQFLQNNLLYWDL